MVGFSGIVIGVVCGESKVLGGSFGCLAGLGSGKAALVKKKKSGIRREVVQRCGKRRELSVKLLEASWESVVAWAEEFQGRWITR